MARVKVRAAGGSLVEVTGDAAPELLAALAERLWALTAQDPTDGSGFGFGPADSTGDGADISDPADPDEVGEPDADPDVPLTPARPVRPLPDPHTKGNPR